MKTPTIRPDVLQESTPFPSSLPQPNQKPAAALTTTGQIAGILFCLLASAFWCEAQSLGDAVNAPELVWTTGGDASWAVDNVASRDGVASARSGGILDRELSWIRTTVIGPTNISFWWKVSSENWDALQFYIGATRQASIVGDVDWEPRNFSVPAGEQTLQWQFTKSRFASQGQDCAWLDQVSLSDVLAPQIITQPTSQVVPAGDPTNLRVVVIGTEPLFYQWRFFGTNLPAATNAWLVLKNSQTATFGDYAVVVTNIFGSTTSLVATVTVTAAQPAFTLQPVSQGSAPDSVVKLTAEAKGSAPLVWEWYYHGEPLGPGEGGSILITNTAGAKLGPYWAVVTNAYGSATSTVATLTFSPLVIWGGAAKIWDVSASGLTTVPTTATNVLAMAGGDDHGLLLRGDGTVVAWGSDYADQTSVPFDLTTATTIAAGTLHSLATRHDGIISLWGNIVGGTDGYNAIPEEATNVVALALGPGAQHALALRADGAVVGWGHPLYGLTNPPANVTNIVGVAAGARFSVALREDGRVVAWGDNRYGQCNVPASATNIVSIAAGWDHTLALRDDGSLLAWQGAANYFGQTNVPTQATNIVGIACGGNHCLALRADGRVFAWGQNARDQTKVPPCASNVVAVAGTSYGSMALIGDGPPRLATPPVDRTAQAGDTVRFIASVVGAWPVSYQWLRNGMPVPGATQLLYSVTNVQATTPAVYSIVASNSLGMITGRVSTVTVLPGPPRIGALPASVAVPTNTTALLTVAAAGSEPLYYQWIFNGAPLADSARIEGANASGLRINHVQTSDLGNYSVVVTNAYGAVTSILVTLRFATPEESIALAVDSSWNWSLAGPASWVWQEEVIHDGWDAAQSGPIGNLGATEISARFNSLAGAVCFWWKVSSQTNADILKFTVDGLERFRISGEVDWQRRSLYLPWGTHTLKWIYTKDASLSGGLDRAWVDEVSFGAPEPPALVQGLTGGVVTEGGDHTFTLSVSGTEPLSYQWRFHGTNLAGKTLSTLAKTNLQLTEAGDYTVVITNHAGAITSPAVTLVVLPPDVATHPWLLRPSATELQILWSTGTLEAADAVEGPWSPVPEAVSPFTVPIDAGSRFFRVQLGNP